MRNKPIEFVGGPADGHKMTVLHGRRVKIPTAPGPGGFGCHTYVIRRFRDAAGGLVEIAMSDGAPVDQAFLNGRGLTAES